MSLDAPHVGFVIAAYAITAIVLCALIMSIVASSRSKRRRLTQLEGRDLGRRQSQPFGGSKEA